MKTTFCLFLLVVSITWGCAQDAGCAAGTDCAAAPITYTTPVVYQAPVVYEAPVVYYAPVYYVTPRATAGYTSCAQSSCSSESIVIHITRNNGTYTSAYCGGSGSTVAYIGSRYARPAGRSYFYRH